jgi:hypothetical protein
MTFCLLNHRSADRGKNMDVLVPVNVLNANPYIAKDFDLSG